MTDFREQLLLRLLGAGWVGMVAGLFQDAWNDDAAGFAALYVVTTALGAVFSSPTPALADDWEDLRWRERVAANLSLLRGSQPSAPRVARVVRLARRETPEETHGPIRRALSAVVRGAAVLVPIVLAAANGAPSEWLIAGAVFPVVIFALRAAELTQRARTSSARRV